MKIFFDKACFPVLFLNIIIRHASFRILFSFENLPVVPLYLNVYMNLTFDHSRRNNIVRFLKMLH